MSKSQEVKKPIDAFFDDEYLGYAKYVVENHRRILIYILWKRITMSIK